MSSRQLVQSIEKKAIRYGYLPGSFSTLDELREDSDEKLFFLSRYNPNHVLHRLMSQPKTSVITFVNAHTLPTLPDITYRWQCCYQTKLCLLFRDIY